MLSILICFLCFVGVSTTAMLNLRVALRTDSERTATMYSMWFVLGLLAATSIAGRLGSLIKSYLAA